MSSTSLDIRDTDMKTIKRYRTHSKNDELQKADNIKCWQEYRTRGTLSNTDGGNTNWCKYLKNYLALCTKDAYAAIL